MADKKQRRLTEKEKNRVLLVDKLTEEMKRAGYDRKDEIISIVKANVVSIGVLLVSAVFFGGLLFIFSRERIHVSEWTAILFAPTLFALIFVHEGLHGITWAHFAKNGYKSIEYGLMIELLTPYCVCKEPLKKDEYIWGGIMPCLILGILPSVISVFNGSLFMLLIGVSMTGSAAGDLMVIWRMLTLKTQTDDIVIIDHPSECGFIVFEKCDASTPELLSEKE